ncbi:Venom serine protease 34 [Gryllus bimaculatus]|nr:Venom serine protease 34 [Gryllus bimaculatus]
MFALQSTNCAGDRVRISLSGDDSLNDAHVYCGQGTFTLLSDTNKLTMVLETLYTSTGGRFLCNITAVRSNTCLCGMKKQSRIVGGQETGVNEFPFMAGLVDSSLRKVYCGATIISNRYALTAAHCTVGRNVAQVGLLVGDHDVSVVNRKTVKRHYYELPTGSDTNAAALYKLLYFKVHPYYNQDPKVEKDNDIALARVDGAIKMSREVMPACLPFRWRDYDFTSAKVEVTGWGTTEFGGATSNVLLKADLYVQSPAQCSAVFGNTVSYRQMCTYNYGKDACQSDSGGPLFWQDPYTGRTHVVGVVSHGIACATDSPGVNTRVTYYLDWVANIVSADDTYCIV